MFHKNSVFGIINGYDGWMRERVSRVLVKKVCPTAPKIFVGEPFRVSNILGVEKLCA